MKRNLSDVPYIFLDWIKAEWRKTDHLLGPNCEMVAVKTPKKLQDGAGIYPAVSLYEF